MDFEVCLYSGVSPGLGTHGLVLLVYFLLSCKCKMAVAIACSRIGRAVGFFPGALGPNLSCSRCALRLLTVFRHFRFR